jgi:hypothetical protein
LTGTRRSKYPMSKALKQHRHLLSTDLWPSKDRNTSSDATILLKAQLLEIERKLQEKAVRSLFVLFHEIKPAILGARQ